MDAVINAIGGVWNVIVASPIGVYCGNVIHAVLPCLK
jgi:hypothetical protein